MSILVDLLPFDFQGFAAHLERSLRERKEMTDKLRNGCDTGAKIGLARARRNPPNLFRISELNEVPLG